MSSDKTPLSDDIERLQSRAYGLADWAHHALELYHATLPTLATADAQLLGRIHAWFFVPLTLWPFSLVDFMAECLKTIEKEKSLPTQLRIVIELMPEVPTPEACDAVAEHELQVQRGNYESVVNTQAKFNQAELALRADPQFQRDWQKLKQGFDVQPYQDYKGVIRRTMGAERNMRPGFPVDMQRPGEAFRLAFDAFCLRWNLYGMLHDDPLLLKLAVNVTPHGTMILIPSFWSLDAQRDFCWTAITALHRTRVPGRQGTALAEGLAERLLQAQRLRDLDLEAAKQKLRGSKKHLFLCQGLGLVEATSPKRLQRLRKLLA